MKLYFRVISVNLDEVPITISGNRARLDLSSLAARQDLRTQLDSLDALDQTPASVPTTITPATPLAVQAPRLSSRVAALLATIGGPHTYDIPLGNGTALRIALPTLKGLSAYRPGRTLNQIFAGCPYNKGHQDKKGIVTDMDFFQAYTLLADIVAEEEKTEAGIGQQFGLLSWPGADLFYPKAREQRIYENTDVWSAWTATHYDGRDESKLYDQAGFITKTDQHLQAIESFIERHKAGTSNASNEAAELKKLGSFVGHALDDDGDWYDFGPRRHVVDRALAFAGLVDSVNP